ncbi:MAG: ATP-binding protein [Pseudomonadota bacterium]
MKDEGKTKARLIKELKALRRDIRKLEASKQGLEKAEERAKWAYEKLRETQGQLIQNEKMAALGRLASGFAHEIRNPLEIILMGVEFLDNRIADDDRMSKMSVDKIKKSVERAGRIITDMLQFSGTKKPEFASIDVCGLLDETRSLIEHRARANKVGVKVDCSGGGMAIEADSGLLQQVFLNLFINAIDAMPEGGNLIVRVYDKTADTVGYKIGYRVSDYFQIGGRMVVVEVEDTGTGIPEDQLTKVFDCFFTTKQSGKGTGLGLSLANLIVDWHKGTIEVKSEQGRGTKFTVNLQPAGRGAS